EGIGATFDAVRSRLEALTALGYCAAGRVERVGGRVRDIRPGDLVACGGEEAAHAEILAVPANLCVAVPDGVDVLEAAFTTPGSGTRTDRRRRRRLVAPRPPSVLREGARAAARALVRPGSVRPRV